MWWYCWEFLLSNFQIVRFTWMNNFKMDKRTIFSREYHVVCNGETNRPSILVPRAHDPATGQTDRGLWGREWPPQLKRSTGTLFERVLMVEFHKTNKTVIRSQFVPGDSWFGLAYRSIGNPGSLYVTRDITRVNYRGHMRQSLGLKIC